jgi:hypothetical protein
LKSCVAVVTFTILLNLAVSTFSLFKFSFLHLSGIKRERDLSDLIEIHIIFFINNRIHFIGLFTSNIIMNDDDDAVP